MRIAILGRDVHPPWNEAVKNMAYELARQLTRLGHSVLLITTEREGTTMDDGVKLRTLPRPGFGKAAVKTILEMEEAGELDIVHLQNMIIHRNLAPALWSLSRKSELPIVAYCCQLPTLSLSNWLHVFRKDPKEALSTKLGMLAPAFITSWTIRRISLVVASSRFIKRKLAASRPNREIEVVPPFLRNERVALQATSVRKSHEHPQILYLGNHKALRGEEDFLRMLSLVKRELPEVRGVAVTTYPLPSRVPALLNSLSLEGSVEFLSRNVDLDIPGLIRSSDLYVFTGQSPAGSIDPPLSIIESLILGTPVLSYDTGGIGEVLDQNSLVGYEDYTSLAELACKVLRRNGANNPRPELLSTYGSEAAAKRFEEIYQGLI
ncbi:hypothetical protein AUF78_04410 [archaeon 13_1_20CM_2_51_12]|nr:MAG: hypothetical protein AUF78_04410 [archaeon 13_1_20CM_2_51_12]